DLESRARRKRMLATGLRNLGRTPSQEMAPARPPEPSPAPAAIEGGSEERARELRTELYAEPANEADRFYLEEVRVRAAPAARRASKKSSRADEAELCLKKGEVFLKKRDYESALRELRRAVDIDATPETLTALAWALASDKGQPASARDEANKLVARALKLDE